MKELKDIDIDGTTIPTARFTDVKLMNGVVSEKGVLTMEEAPKDGFKHLVDYNEQLDDFLVHFRYYENGEHAVSPHFGVSDGRYKLIRYYNYI